MARLRLTLPHLFFRCCALLAAALLLSLPAGAAKKKPPLRPVNLNTATALELQQVPGIGPSTADKILQMRKSYGPFKNVDDLRAIKGIGPRRLDKMRKYLTVGKVAAKKSATSESPVSKSPPKGPVPSAKPNLLSKSPAG